VVPTDDPDAITTALHRMLSGSDGLPRPAPEAVQRFSYARLAVEMADQVEQAIARRRS
jgi:hypothetical protein